MSEKGVYSIRITRQAKKDIETLSSKLKAKLKDIVKEVLVVNPFEGKKLLGDLAGCYSYLLSYRDRIIYSIDDKSKTVFLERARTHHGN